jgi:hypothetical protein
MATDLRASARPREDLGSVGEPIAIRLEALILGGEAHLPVERLARRVLIP